MQEVLRIVLATRNPGKILEMRDVLKDLDIQLLTEEDLELSFPDVDEDADSLEGNAAKKAESVFQRTGLPALADDTGLEVQALFGKPGVHSARYAGDDCDPQRNRRKLLDALAGESNRFARFRTVVALVSDGGTQLFEGVCDGSIGQQEKGGGGFGYDAIFIPTGTRKTFAEMSPSEKNRISHRARALQKLRTHLESEGTL